MLVLRPTWRECLLALISALLLLPVQAQQIPRKPTNALSPRAALIFRGTVLAVEHVPPVTQNGIGTVRVTFQVDQGIRGVRAGQRLTISEWDGLWSSGERYRVGEALTLYLHAPSANLGLTSPVGEQGRVAMAEESTPKRQQPASPKQRIPRGARRIAVED